MITNREDSLETSSFQSATVVGLCRLHIHWFLGEMMRGSFARWKQAIRARTLLEKPRRNDEGLVREMETMAQPGGQLTVGQAK